MALEGGEKKWNVEDNDNDALNDETFGGDGGDFNWEEAQSALHAFEKQKTKHSNGKSQHEAQVPQGSRVISLQELEQSFDRELFKEDDFDNENMLEESISRLVMDEFDNEEEAKSKLRRLGGTNRSSLNTYFMPDQVAIKHHWFEKELPGGSSLFGPSVWSMHPTNTVGDVPPNHRMPNVPNAAHLQSHRINEPQVQAGIDNVLGKLADPRLMDRVPSKHVAPKSNSSLPSHKPVFKTVEEIERELLEGSDISNDSKVNQVTKKVDGNNQRPKVITAEELERELFESSTPPPKPFPESIHAVRNTGVPGSPSFSQTGSASPGPLRPPPGMAGMSPQMLQRMPPPHMMPNSPAFAQRMMANPQLHPQVAAQLAFHQQQQHMRMMQMNHLRGRMPMMMPHFPPLPHPLRPGFPMPPPNHGLLPQFMRPMDPYRGLMNDRDKQRLRNISIVQLQNDHPYTTDYYSLMYKVRHGSSDPKRQRDCLSKLYPRKADESMNRNNYQPAHFENSLGKLQAVSALAPKKAIDTVIRVVDSGPSRGGMKAYRYLLLEIEKLYECLLKIQEADIRKTLLMNADESTLVQRHENERKVKEVLEPQHKLSEILSVHKGKMLVSRLIPLMDNTFKFYLFAHMVGKFPEWGLTNEIDRTYPFLRHCIFSADMSNLVYTFNGTVPRSIYEQMVSSKLGLSLLMAVFHRAECIMLGTVANDEQADYLNRVYLKGAHLIVQAILSSVQDLASPIEISPNLLQHFKRWGVPLEQLLPLQTEIIMWEKQSIPYIQ